MKGLILEALMEYCNSDKCYAMDKNVGTPDLEALAEFIVNYITSYKEGWNETR